MTSARASARRCCWPPDSFVASRSASSSSCTAWSTRITLSRTCCREYVLSPTLSGNAAFSNTVMCGQMAYDWNTMPKPRRFGATKTPLDEENTTRPFTEISPARGRSSPAIDRSVVVLPQPLGPSSVKRRPSSTVKLTSCAALTMSPRSFGYSVKSPSTLSNSCPLPPATYSLIPYRDPTHRASSTRTNSERMKSTPSADSSTYCPFCHSSQMTIDTTRVSGL